LPSGDGSHLLNSTHRPDTKLVERGVERRTHQRRIMKDRLRQGGTFYGDRLAVRSANPHEPNHLGTFRELQSRRLGAAGRTNRPLDPEGTRLPSSRPHVIREASQARDGLLETVGYDSSGAPLTQQETLVTERVEGLAQRDTRD
jgi:hypothetical protein